MGVAESGRGLNVGERTTVSSGSRTFASVRVQTALPVKRSTVETQALDRRQSGRGHPSLQAQRQRRRRSRGQRHRSSVFDLRRGLQRAGPRRAGTGWAVCGPGAGGAGGAAPGAGRPLQPNRGVAPQRRGPDGFYRRSCAAAGAPPVLGCVFTVLTSSSSRTRTGTGAGASLHPRHVACEEGPQRLRLGGLGGELVVEGEGLDGQGGGPLLFAVTDHGRLQVRRTGETTWTRRETGNRQVRKIKDPLCVVLF